MHTLLDRINGRLQEYSLQEFVIYIIFYPSITAGPIDRVQHFVRNLRQPYHPTVETMLLGAKRILIGIFRKFVLADGLALFSLSSTNFGEISSAGWLWVVLYSYAFRIYFDFSGYTDIAIGIGNLVGIQLPENFDQPYRKQNLTLFWNSWHMTLANWFRAYFFNPLTRSLRTEKVIIPMPAIIFIGQLSTFLLIGLWHGITWNFAIWGAWHGIGLFIHNRWSELLKTRPFFQTENKILKNFIEGTSTLITFHYVTIGWIWFVLSSPSQSIYTMRMLFGL
jgi:D-alanyl-lipoteichoic acid acyltransferase DltB (MBOAT superfamily)